MRIPDSKPAYIKLRHIGADKNPIGTPHVIIAKVTDKSDNPIPGISVAGGIIEGVNSNRDVRTRWGYTNESGECFFVYNGKVAGEDAIEACVDDCPDGMPQTYISMKWYEPKPADIELRHIGADKNPIGTPHSFIAKLFDQHRHIMVGIPLHGGIIEGVNTKSFGGMTNIDGECSFTYIGTNPGEDNIEIYWEEMPGQMQPIAYITKKWY